MKLPIPTSVLLLILFLIGISSCRLVQKNSTTPFDTVKFEKGVCLNKCKAYYFDCDKNGNAEIRIPGKQEIKLKFRLTRTELKSLKKLLDPSQINGLKDEYDYGDEDTQQKILTVTSAKGQKTIRFGQNIPEQLKQIEAQFDKIADARQAEK